MAPSPDRRSLEAQKPGNQAGGKLRVRTESRGALHAKIPEALHRFPNDRDARCKYPNAALRAGLAHQKLQGMRLELKRHAQNVRDAPLRAPLPGRNLTEERGEPV